MLDSLPLLDSKYRHIWHLQRRYFPPKALGGYLDALLTDKSMLLEFFERIIALRWDRAIGIFEILRARDGLASRLRMRGIRKVQQLEELGFPQRLYGLMVGKEYDELHEFSMVQMMQAYGVTHAFYMPMIVTRALVEMEKVGIRRIMTHGEKAAAYMADGYARAGPSGLSRGASGNVVMDAEADLEVIVEPPFTHVPPFRSEPEMAMIREALQVLARARRPVIVAGGGVASSQAQREVVELAERLSIPVATSLNAKGTIPDQHPLSVGVCGTYSRWCANRVVAEADLVFFIGSHTGSQVTTEWQIPRMGTPVMQLDIDPAELGRSYPIQVGLQGDARASLRKMIAAAEPPAPRTEWLTIVRHLVQEWRAEVVPLANSNASPIRPGAYARN
jgi:thiamine pyrophosphate-dependent acetolactate synthase large subunit-like protein